MARMLSIYSLHLQRGIALLSISLVLHSIIFFTPLNLCHRKLQENQDIGYTTSTLDMKIYRVMLYDYESTTTSSLQVIHKFFGALPKMKAKTWRLVCGAWSTIIIIIDVLYEESSIVTVRSQKETRINIILFECQLLLVCVCVFLILKMVFQSINYMKCQSQTMIMCVCVCEFS